MRRVERGSIRDGYVPVIRAQTADKWQPCGRIDIIPHDNHTTKLL